MSDNQLERLKREEAEAEAQMFGNPEDTTTSPAPIVEEVTTPEELEAGQIMEDIIVAPSEPVQQPEEKKRRTNWKHRYTTYKAATDTTIHQLRGELSSLKSDLSQVMVTLQNERSASQEVQSDPFDGVFSDEDVETFGSDGLDVVKKATQSVLDKQVKPLQEQIARQDVARAEDLKRQAHDENVRAYNGFLENLGVLVPNYKELNVSAEFLEWMKLPDKYSGLTRSVLFQRAESGRDVARVAEFFVEFNQLKAKPSTIPPAMERHITPVGSGVATSVPSTVNNTEVIYTSEIDKFYDDVMKGRYEGRQKEVLAIEAKIDAASLIPGGIQKG